jgi:hypothetical protein
VASEQKQLRRFVICNCMGEPYPTARAAQDRADRDADTKTVGVPPLDRVSLLLTACYRASIVTVAMSATGRSQTTDTWPRAATDRSSVVMMLTALTALTALTSPWIRLGNAVVAAGLHMVPLADVERALPAMG